MKYSIKEILDVSRRPINTVLDSFNYVMSNIFSFGQPAREELEKQANLTSKQKWIIENIRTIVRDAEITRGIANDWYHIHKDLQNGSLDYLVTHPEIDKRNKNDVVRIIRTANTEIRRLRKEGYLRPDAIHCWG